MLHQRQPLGSRADEFSDIEKVLDYVPRDLLEHYSPRLFAETKSGYPPAGSFGQAREILQGMPGRFFLWVHLLAPHWPYLPNSENVGRFLPSNEVRTIEEQMTSHARLIQKLRLRYDEFIADADSAFGGFLAELEGAQRLRNTAVIVSADHGESFEGGFYGHGSPYQTRPIVHIPLIIHLPGQENGSRIGVTMDQTSLAPSILEIAGVPRGDWMRGPSLLPWLNRDNQGADQGLAFTQYLETDSIFRPVRNGTVGVIDGRHQYVLDLATGKGILRGLDEAQMKDLDRSAQNPALAQTLRDTIYARFPDLPRRSV
jgi:arylsulfatase A-like enzyme